MKRFLIALFLIGGLLCGPNVIWAGEKTLTFAWEQAIPVENDLKGWNLYVGTATGGPYTLLTAIPFASAQTTYTSTVAFTSPDGKRVQYFFVLQAEDKLGNKSAYSSEASTWIDFEAPGTPMKLNITVTSK